MNTKEFYVTEYLKQSHGLTNIGTCAIEYDGTWQDADDKRREHFKVRQSAYKHWDDVAFYTRNFPKV